MAKFLQSPAAKEFIETVKYLILGIVLAVASYTVLGAVLDTKNPIVTVVSYSMVPTLTRGDLLVLKGIETSEMAAGRENGTIIVYYQPNRQQLIVHRVWKINSDETINTWGDANTGPDPWDIPADWVRGKMILRIPFLGYPRLLLKDFLGF
ncbi:MAG: signal peptidase I [Nanoarchaeota archaeon]|nr:signal peptidase I [Nanoarchaeota archaeon]MBU4300149.1 signal peptidase I [Nanoarchaeota archaeon]MBU4451567.1 signal peptidase I [Nanoarchaeota archaeon]MCG2724355.1 signal peptidase I [archaeon]